MPELPEVETMRRGILGIVGSQIQDVRSGGSRKRPILIAPKLPALRRRTVGRHVTAVDRVGKRVVVRLDSGDSIIFEPRMTGLVLVADPPTSEHLRLRIGLAGGKHDELLFWDRRGLGLVRLVDAAEFVERYGDRQLGPDALSMSATLMAERLCSSRRAIKVALLDQTRLAGIGNLYASEILHLARIHPELPCHRLRTGQWERLHQATVEILTHAIRYEGSTLGDGTYRNALAQQGEYQNHHRVYDRQGDVCLSCGKAQIRRIVQVGRSTFFCPNCQRVSRRTVGKPR